MRPTSNLKIYHRLRKEFDKLLYYAWNKHEITWNKHEISFQCKYLPLLFCKITIIGEQRGREIMYFSSILIDVARSRIVDTDLLENCLFCLFFFSPNLNVLSRVLDNVWQTVTGEKERTGLGTRCLSCLSGKIINKPLMEIYGMKSL